MAHKHTIQIALLTLLLSSSAAMAKEHTNFRVGVGSFVLDIDHAPDGLPDGSQYGMTIFAEYPQSNHTATRFLIYRTDTDGVKVQGVETQLYWGWGLAQPGFRIYTGPTWHWERLQVPRGNDVRKRTTRDWAWQLGTGFQYQAITLDYAATLRDNDYYKTENALAGASKGNVWTHTILLSYRF